MNTKILTHGILIALVVYGMKSAIGAETSDDKFSVIIDCDDPLCDGSGMKMDCMEMDKLGIKEGL